MVYARGLHCNKAYKNNGEQNWAVSTEVFLHFIIFNVEFRQVYKAIYYSFIYKRNSKFQLLENYLD